MLAALIMGPAAATGGASLIGLVVTSGWFGSSPPSTPLVVPATKDNVVFEHWAADDASLWDEGAYIPPNCTFWNGSVTFSSSLCSHFSLSRMASNSAGRATERAIKCAAHYETECILSPEIGVSIPAAFIYDGSGSGMRMLIAPRVIHNVGIEPSGVADLRHVRVQDPEELSNGRVVKMNYTVDIEYLPGGSRAPVSERLNGSDAYCVQLLRAAFVDECWQQLD